MCVQTLSKSNHQGLFVHSMHASNGARRIEENIVDALTLPFLQVTDVKSGMTARKKSGRKSQSQTS